MAIAVAVLPRVRREYLASVVRGPDPRSLPHSPERNVT
jgi:hypothetical protein